MRQRDTRETYIACHANIPTSFSRMHSSVNIPRGVGHRACLRNVFLPCNLAFGVTTLSPLRVHASRQVLGKMLAAA